MGAYLRPLVSSRLYMTIVRQKKKDFGAVEKIQSKEYFH